ncbi:EKC/KEOPS complex subunit TP53RK [Prorops nasuta]|uniref:EKC/KEOPS complex subunit TP53RK n=1 Tax=Prorops nasuta TaxID=863751 RepID=UPI0034CEACF2
MKHFELIAQGAEARLYKGCYLGRPTIIKERFVKKYRHKDLDTRITKDRIKAEARALVRAKMAGIVTPAIFLVDIDRRRIYMEYIENATVLKVFIEQNMSGNTDVNIKRFTEFVARGLGTLIAKLHMKNIIHGDLTTSNILLKNISLEEITEEKAKEAANTFAMIDFGLARVESTQEDKAVDLYVLERSLLSAHSEIPSFFDEIFNHYKQSYLNKVQCKEIISKYKEVQARGRKRIMIG